MRRWLALAILLLGGASALWAGATAFTGQPALSPSEAGAWHPHSEKMYMENWIFHAVADDGGFFWAVFMVSNAGLYNNNPGFSASYYAPDGTVYANELRVDNDRFHAATDRFDVRIGNARLWREGQKIRLAIQEGKVLANLTLAATSVPWMNGSGRLVVGEPREHWSWIMPAPRGTVEGTVTAAGQTFTVRGRGYADQCWSNKAYFNFSKNWLSLYVATPARSLTFHQIVENKKAGGGTVRSLMVADDGKPPRSGRVSKVQITDWLPDKKYRHPRAFTIDAAVDGADLTIEAANGGGGERIDPLGSCSALEQKIVRLLVADPMLYRVVHDVTVSVATDGQVEQERGRAISTALYFEQ
jgi:hypothetical protein